MGLWGKSDFDAVSKQVGSPGSVLCAKQISTRPRCGALRCATNGLHSMLDVRPGSENAPSCSTDSWRRSDAITPHPYRTAGSEGARTVGARPVRKLSILSP